MLADSLCHTDRMAMKQGSYDLDDFDSDRETIRLQDQLEAVWAREESVYQALGFECRGRGLEVGCGPGFVLAKLREKTSVVGIDLSRAPLERAIPPVVQADARQLPFRHDQFDWALARLVLRHSPEPEDILSEMRRVVRSEGKIVVSDTDDAAIVIHPEPLGWRTTLAERHAQVRARGGNPHIGRTLYQIMQSAGTKRIRVGALTLTSGEIGAAKFAEILLTPLVSGLDTQSSDRTQRDLAQWAANDGAFGMASLIIVVGIV